MPRRSLILLAPAAGAAALVWWATSGQGPGLTPDSAEYLSAAGSLLAGQGLRRVDGSAFAHWPPLYPILLAGAQALLRDPWSAARLVGALSAAALSLLAGLHVLSVTGSTSFGLVAALGVAAWTPVLRVSSYVWSDAPFAVFTLAGLFSLAGRARAGGGLRLDAAIAGGLACLTRYLGAVAGLVGGWFAWRDARRGRGLRALHAAVFVAIALLPLVAWTIRNLAVAGSSFGGRDPAYRTWTTNLRDMGSATLDAFVPWKLPTWGKGLALLAFLALLATLSRGSPKGEGGRGRRPAFRPDPLLLWLPLYTGSLWAWASWFRTDRLDERLLLPALVALWVLGLRVLAARTGAASGLGSVRVALPLFLVMAVCLLPNGFRAARVLALAREEGFPGFTDPTWRSSAILAGLRASPAAEATFSNEPEAVWLATRKPVALAPRRDPAYAPDRPSGDLAAMRRAVESGASVRLVWFQGGERSALHPPSDLARQFRLEEEVRAPEGVVFRVERR